MERLLTNNKYSGEDNKHYEGAYTQGNGYLNLRATFEEDLSGATQNDLYWRLPANVTLEKARHPKSKWGLYVPGVYGVHPILGEEIVNLPYGIGINLYSGGERLDMEESDYGDFSRSLNLSNGLLTRALVWRSPEGDIAVTFRRYCSLQHKHTIVQEVELCSASNAELEFESFMDAGVTTNGYSHFTDRCGAYRDGLELYASTDSEQRIGMASRCFGRALGEARFEPMDVNGRIRETFRVGLKAGETVAIRKYVWVATSADEDYRGGIEKHLAAVVRASAPDKADFSVHEKLWKDKWNRSDIVIQGNEQLQNSLRFSIYHLLRSANESDKVAIDAKGYAGEAYFGHYFWDTEIYLLPFYIYTQPEYAKKLIAYRYRTLQGARENARRYGYAGARYPWESCVTGTEQCSNWQYADLEIHVTADVVYGLAHYCEATGDREFLLGPGLEMMVETARYWVSRIDRIDGEYRLMGVMGPDEYLPYTHDNAFTNYMVKFSLRKTLETLELAKTAGEPDCTVPLGVTAEERTMFAEIANQLAFGEDAERKFVAQCAGFENFLDVDFDVVWTDRSKPFGQFISQERNYRSKALKQADVVALLYLFRDRFDEETKRNCLAYYEPITTHDSSLSYIFHSLLYNEIDDRDKAYAFLEKSLELDLGRKGAAEGIHIANSGGIWQAVVLGMGGFRGLADSDLLDVKPRLPDSIRALEYNVCVRGKWHRVAATHEGVQVKELIEERGRKD
ncbi:glycosyl hydrolase family 65 protein [Cohnella sp.]|uniref:glycosyl hydrolase family 65 protein n=1 Tax=Cohnella sp. TaxID=1883426 RepID=UPI0037047779